MISKWPRLLFVASNTGVYLCRPFITYRPQAFAMYVFRTVCLFMWRGAKISGQTRFPSTERPNSRSRIHIQHPNRQATRHKNTFKLWNVYRHDKLHLLSRGRRVRYICPSLRCHLNVKKLNFTTLFFGMYDLPISL